MFKLCLTNTMGFGTKICLTVGLFSIALGLPANTKTISFDCSFNRYVDSDGGPNNTTFKFVINHDTLSQKSVLVGNAGVAELTLLSADASSGITFLETTAVPGDLNTTTIEFATLNAVHSRHHIVPGMKDGLMSSQYYGKCLFND